MTQKRCVASDAMKRGSVNVGCISAGSGEPCIPSQSVIEQKGGAQACNDKRVLRSSQAPTSRSLVTRGAYSEGAGVVHQSFPCLNVTFILLSPIMYVTVHRRSPLKDRHTRPHDKRKHTNTSNMCRRYIHPFLPARKVNHPTPVRGLAFHRRTTSLTPPRKRLMSVPAAIDRPALKVIPSGRSLKKDP